MKKPQSFIKETNNLVTELRFETLDHKGRACPVCGRAGQKLPSGEFKHIKRIRFSPTLRQVKTTYCPPLKKSA